MITKFRCSNIKLLIETGRWSMTPREERICHLCNVGLGTEFHFFYVPLLVYKCLDVNLFQFIILDMQTYTK
jgi:hypothetical protein